MNTLSGQQWTTRSLSNVAPPSISRRAEVIDTIAETLRREWQISGAHSGAAVGLYPAIKPHQDNDMTDIPYTWKGAGRVQSAEETRERSRKAFNLWRYADYITPDCLAAEYFRARGIGWLAATRFRDTVRWIPVTRHPSGLRLPAIYCAITDTSGAFRAVHRIYLKRERPEKFGSPASFGPISGHAIRLATIQQVIDAGDLVVGEGLETTASACALLGLPGWCGIAAGNIRKSLILPPEIHMVTIAVDRDWAGERAAEAAATRWRAEGRIVRFLTPDADGDDCNDVLTQRLKIHGR